MGSHFCCLYFLKFASAALEKLQGVLAEKSVKVTLCLPIFSQGHLGRGKEELEKILRAYGGYIDEISVNDFGMLRYVKEKYPDVKINFGRMMNKDVRDIRYDDYFNAVHKPTISTLSSSIAEEYGVSGVDLDITNRFLDLSDLKQTAAIYYPYVFLTTGNICEFASVGLPVEKKFRPNLHCNAGCRKLSVSYENDAGIAYRKVGRTVYFPVVDFSVSGKEDYRLVYQPLDLLTERGKDEG